MNVPPSTQWDNLDRDQLLLIWQQAKDELAAAKETEMELRKHIVKRAFPNPEEGTNKIDLGQGYELKSVIKYNYKLTSNEQVEAGLNRIEKIGNQGKFIAERLISWTPNFLLSEYRTLQEEASNGSEDAKQILAIITEFVTITDAAPTLEIKEPKVKK